MSWIRRETEKGTVQYICPRCHDYHEFREDFGERTFSENYIFCRRCGARNGTGNAPTLTPPNEWVSVENALPPNMDDVLVVVQNNGECWTVTGYYSNTSNVWYAMLNGQDTKMDVLWWMPLPAPPNCRPPEGEE